MARATVDGKPWGWWAKLQLRDQKGDDAGQWIEMGGLGLIKFRLPNGRVVSAFSRYIGPSALVSGGGMFYVSGDKNVPDGVYHLTTNFVDSGVKAQISEATLEKMGYKTDNLPYDPNTVVNLKSATRTDATSEDIENSKRRLPRFKNASKLAAGRERSEITYGELQEGDVVYDERSGLYGEVLETYDDETGELNPWVRWETGEIAQVGRKNPEDKVFAWKSKEKPKATVPTVDRMASEGEEDEEPTRKPASELKKGDKFVEDGVTYTVVSAKPIKPKGETEPIGYAVSALPDGGDPDIDLADFNYGPNDEVLLSTKEKSTKKEKVEGTVETTIGRYGSELKRGMTLVTPTGEEFLVVGTEKDPRGTKVYLQDSAGNLTETVLIKDTLASVKATAVTKPNKNGVLETKSTPIMKASEVKHDDPSKAKTTTTTPAKFDPSKESDASLIVQYDGNVKRQSEVQKIISQLSKRDVLSAAEADALKKAEKERDALSKETIAIEEELFSRGYELNENDEFVKQGDEKKGTIAEGISYEIFPDGEVVFFISGSSSEWNRRNNIVRRAAAELSASGVGSLKDNYYGKGNHYKDLNKSSTVVTIDPLQGTVEGIQKQLIARVTELINQDAIDVVEEEETFSGRPGTKGTLGGGVSFEINGAGKITFSVVDPTDKKVKDAFSWLMFDSDGIVAENDTEKGEDGKYASIVFSGLDADRAKLLSELQKRLAVETTDDNADKPELGTPEYWEWVQKRAAEGKLSKEDFKEAANLLADAVYKRASENAENTVKSFLDSFFSVNPNALKSQAEEALKSSDLFKSIESFESAFKKYFGDSVVDNADYKKIKKALSEKIKESLTEQFNVQVSSFVRGVGDKPEFEIGESNEEYWRWAKEQIDNGTLSDDDREELYANLRDSTVDSALIQLIESIEEVLADLIKNDPKITRDEARKAVRKAFANYARDMMMSESMVAFFGKDFVGTKGYRDAIRAAQREINFTVNEQIKEVINKFIPIRRAVTPLETHEVKTTDLKIGDKVVVPGTENEVATVIGIREQNGRPVITLEKEDGTTLTNVYKKSSVWQKLGKKETETTEIIDDTESTTEDTTEAEPVAEEGPAKPSTPRPVSGPEELDFTGLSEEQKRNALNLMVALEEMRRAREKLPSGAFPGWGEVTEPTYIISEADLAWYKNEVNAEILYKMRELMDELGFSKEEREYVLQYLRQLPYEQARQHVINFAIANPLSDSEFGKRASNIKEAIENFKSLIEAEKITVPATLKDVVNTIPASFRTDYSLDAPTDDDFTNYLTNVLYPNIDPDELLNSSRHKKKRERARRLFDDWYRANKKRVFDQVFQIGDVQIRFNKDGKMTKRSFAVLAHTLKNISELLPVGGAPVRVTIADKDWVKEVSGADGVKAFTTFDETGVNIILSEDLFGPRRKRETEGEGADVDPIIGELLKQYGIAFYAGAVGAGFDRRNPTSELERIFRNKFDVQEGSSGVAEFAAMFRDYTANLLNGTGIEDERFRAFLAQAVNTGYRPTINLSDSLDLDGTEVGAVSPAKNDSPENGGISGAKELTGNALKKLEETVSYSGDTPVRWMSGAPTPSVGGVAGTLPDPVTMLTYKFSKEFNSFAFEFFGKSIEEALRDGDADEAFLQDFIEAFNTAVEESRLEEGRFRVIKVNGTSTYIRWKDSDFDSPEDAKQTLIDVVKEAKQLYKEDPLNDFPRYITLTKRGRFMPGFQYFGGPNEDWTGYSTYASNGAFIVLDIKTRKMRDSYKGETLAFSKNKRKNKLLADLAHEDGHLTLKLRSNDHDPNSPAMRALSQMDLPEVSDYGNTSLIENFAELRRVLFNLSNSGQPIPDDLVPFWNFFKDLTKQPIDSNLRAAIQVSRMESSSDESSLSEPFPEVVSVSDSFSKRYDEFRNRRPYYSTGAGPAGPRGEAEYVAEHVRELYNTALSRETQYTESRNLDSKLAFEDAMMNIKNFYDSWYGLIAFSTPKNSKSVVGSRIATDDSRFRQWNSGKTDPKTGKGIFKNKESVATYTDQDGNVYTLVFNESGLADNFLDTAFGREKQTRMFVATFTGDLSSEDMQKIDSMGLENYRSIGGLGLRVVSTLSVKNGTIEMVETTPKHQRRGLATAAIVLAEQESESKIKHSETRTVAGDAWALATDGEPPVNDFSFPPSSETSFPSIDRMASESVGNAYTEILHPNIKDFTSSNESAGLGPNNSVVGEVSTETLSRMAGNPVDEANVLEKMEEIKSGNGFGAPAIVYYNPSTNEAFVADGNHRVEASRRLGLSHTPVRVITSYTRANSNAQKVNNGFNETDNNNAFDGKNFPRDVHPAFVFGADDVLGANPATVAPTIDRMLDNLGVWAGDLEEVKLDFLPDEDENLYEILRPGKFVRIKGTGEIARVFDHNLTTKRDDKTETRQEVNLGGVRVLVLKGINDAMDFFPLPDDMSMEEFREKKSRVIAPGYQQPETIVNGESEPEANDYRSYEERLVGLEDLEDVTESFMKLSDNPVLLMDTMFLVERETGRKGRIHRYVEPGKVEIAELVGYDEENEPIYSLFTANVQDLNPIQEQIPTPPGQKSRSFFGTSLAITKSLVDRINTVAGRLFAFGYLSEQEYKAIVGAARGKFITKSGAELLLRDLNVYNKLRELKLKQSDTPLRSGERKTTRGKGVQFVEKEPDSGLLKNKNLTDRQNESFNRRVNSGNFPGMFTDAEIKELNEKFKALANRDQFSEILNYLNLKELVWGMENGADINELVDKYYRDADGGLALPTKELARQVYEYIYGEAPAGADVEEPDIVSEPEPEPESEPEAPASPVLDFEDFIPFKKAVQDKSSDPSVDRMASMPVVVSQVSENSPFVYTINEIEQALIEDGLVDEKEALKIVNSLDTISREDAEKLADNLQTRLLNKRLLNDESVEGLRVPEGYNKSKLENYVPATQEPSVSRMADTPEVKLGEEQQAVLDHLLNSDNAFFLTGEAGSGKTTLVKEFVSVLNDAGVNVLIGAPTGIAALNAGGRTLHSLFQINPNKPLVSLDIAEWEAGLSDKGKRTLNAVDVLIVDEISMVRADTLEFMDRALRALRRKFDKPFGGVQVVMVGDPLQLPPVLQEDTAEGKMVNLQYVSPNFFEAALFKEFPLEGFRLSKLYRQSEEADSEFVAVLRRIQVGEATKEDIKYLNDIAKRNQENRPAESIENIMHLTPTRAGADMYNARQLQSLNTELVSVRGDFSSPNDKEKKKRLQKLISQGLFPKENLQLKEGAQVMFLRNDRDGRWVNGTVGIVERIDVRTRKDDGSADKIDLFVKVGPNIYKVEKTNFELTSQTLVTKTGASGTTDSIEVIPEGAFTQYPITLAWATTIHKAQGLSLDAAVVDLEIVPQDNEEEAAKARVFAPGQLYVALSRIRTAEGLYFTAPIELSDVKVDDRAIQFIRKMFGRNLNPAPASISRMESPAEDFDPMSGFSSPAEVRNAILSGRYRGPDGQPLSPYQRNMMLSYIQALESPSTSGISLNDKEAEIDDMFRRAAQGDRTVFKTFDSPDISGQVDRQLGEILADVFSPAVVSIPDRSNAAGTPTEQEKWEIINPREFLLPVAQRVYSQALFNQIGRIIAGLPHDTARFQDIANMYEQYKKYYQDEDDARQAFISDVGNLVSDQIKELADLYDNRVDLYRAEFNGKNVTVGLDKSFRDIPPVANLIMKTIRGVYMSVRDDMFDKNKDLHILLTRGTGLQDISSGSFLGGQTSDRLSLSNTLFDFDSGSIVIDVGDSFELSLNKEFSDFQNQIDEAVKLAPGMYYSRAAALRESSLKDKQAVYAAMNVLFTLTHELAHEIFNYLKLNNSNFSDFIDFLYNHIMNDVDLKSALQEYAHTDADEFFADIFAQLFMEKFMSASVYEDIPQIYKDQIASLLFK